MSHNYPHAMAHSRGARPRVRGVFGQNEADQENLCGPPFDMMHQDVENNLKFYENLINENFAPRDRGAVGVGGNPNVPQMAGNLPNCRGFRAPPPVNRAEDNEDCQRPPFSKPIHRGLCPGMSNGGPHTAYQCPDNCAGRNQRRCNVDPAGTEAPAPPQGMPYMHPVNQMAWQPRNNNFPEMANAFPRSEDHQRLHGAQPQPGRGPGRLQEQPAHPHEGHAGAAPQGLPHHDHLDHLAHHAHHDPQGPHAPNLNQDPRPQAPRGSQQPQDLMEDPHHHHHHHHHEERQPGERDEKTVSALRHLVQFRRSPSYVKCDKKESLEFLEVCSQKPEGASKCHNRELPRIPCLQDNALKDLISCEKQDVESALYLVSDEKKTYKKPCPKQQKAQMTVQAIVHGHGHAAPTCGKEYAPLEHPDPDDISPEVAATMMFCQEQGIDLAGCPKLAINFLFPEEAKPPFPEKENVSVVGPDQGQQEDMIERSANVSAEGVSDSAYTRTMKEKGEDLGPQKSYDVDFAVGHTKREYVLVAQKPQRVNRAQFRGGASPSWFPGFFAAFPDEDGALKVVASPSRLLHRAWVHSKPVNMPQSDIIVVD